MDKNPRTEVPGLKETTQCPRKHMKTDGVNVYHCDIRDKQKILKCSGKGEFYPKYENQSSELWCRKLRESEANVVRSSAENYFPPTQADPAGLSQG